MKFVRLLPIVVVLVAVGANPVFAEAASNGVRKPSMDKALEREGPATDKLQIIVTYKPGAAARVKGRMAGKVEGIRGELRGIGAFSVDMRRGNLKELCADLEVLRCSINARVHGGSADQLASTDTVLTSSTDTTTSSTLSSSTLSTYDAQHLRATLGVRSRDTAYGVGIAIIDSGIAPTPDLGDRVKAFFDFTAGGIRTAPFDPYGHGTHIAGLIAGNGALSNGKYVGVATGARLIGLKVLDAQGAGYTSDVIAAIEFAIANRASLGIDVINLSLGHPIFESPSTDPLVLAVEHAAAAGIVVVTSAGNHGLNAAGEIGYAGITSPGNAPSAITVGSLRTKATADRSDDEVSLFSSRGPTWYEGRVKPDLVAPGQALIAINDPTTTLFQNPLLRADISPYIKLSGTSMGSAVATGVVALVISANRQDEGSGSAPLTPNMVKALLQYTALPLSNTDPGVPSAIVQGAGGINAAGAIALARAIDPNVGVGHPWLDGAVLPYSTIAETVYTWAQQIVWGDHIVSGDTITWYKTAWAQQIVWGDDDQIVWGDSLNISFGQNLVEESFAVWSSQIVWGDDDQIVWGDDDQIVWGDLDQIVWGDDDQIVWGDDDQIVWGDTFGFLEN